MTFSLPFWSSFFFLVFLSLHPFLYLSVSVSNRFHLKYEWRIYFIHQWKQIHIKHRYISLSKLVSFSTNKEGKKHKHTCPTHTPLPYIKHTTQHTPLSTIYITLQIHTDTTTYISIISLYTAVPWPPSNRQYGTVQPYFHAAVLNLLRRRLLCGIE